MPQTITQPRKNVFIHSVEELEPQPEETQAEDWLCARCMLKISAEKDRFIYNSQSEFEFVNPAGFVFNIITFSNAEGCVDVGDPTLEHTWFPGHSWSFCMCKRCGIHLGWKYREKSIFFGLIRPRLIKAGVIFN